MNNSKMSNPLAEAAADLVEDGQIVGLGSGRTATEFVRELGRRVRQGLRIRGVPTSQATAEVAIEGGIPLLTFQEVESIDITIDGADEVDPQLDLIKGLGGAMVREKIVASASRRLVIVVDSGKLVSVLGERCPLPVEVVPFGLDFCRQRLTRLGCNPSLREDGGKPYVTDNGNYILHCKVPPMDNAEQWEMAIRAVPGVVGTGLFLGMADTILIRDGNEIKIRRRAHA